MQEVAGCARGSGLPSNWISSGLKHVMSATLGGLLGPLHAELLVRDSLLCCGPL